MVHFRRGYPVKRKSYNWVWFAVVMGAILGVLAYAFLNTVDASLRQELQIQQDDMKERLKTPQERLEANNRSLGVYTFDNEAVHISEKLQHASGYRNFEPTDNPQSGSINTGVSHNPQVTYNLGGEL